MGEKDETIITSLDLCTKEDLIYWITHFVPISKKYDILGDMRVIRLMTDMERAARNRSQLLEAVDKWRNIACDNNKKHAERMHAHVQWSKCQDQLLEAIKNELKINEDKV